MGFSVLALLVLQGKTVKIGQGSQFATHKKVMSHCTAYLIFIFFLAGMLTVNWVITAISWGTTSYQLATGKNQLLFLEWQRSLTYS